MRCIIISTHSSNNNYSNYKTNLQYLGFRSKTSKIPNQKHSKIKISQVKVVNKLVQQLSENECIQNKVKLLILNPTVFHQSNIFSPSSKGQNQIKTTERIIFVIRDHCAIKGITNWHKYRATILFLISHRQRKLDGSVLNFGYLLTIDLVRKY